MKNPSIYPAEDDGTVLDGPRFFGRMTASVSHEIKNVLAIVNEHAGLLEDLATMAEQGRPPAPERLQRIAGSILGQVRRADVIVRQLNRFAHSTDEVEAEVVLAEVVELMLALAARTAANRGVRLELVSGAVVRLRTRPFALEHVLWRCLERAMGLVDESRTVRVTLESAGVWCQLCFSGLRGLTAVTDVPNGPERALLEELRAELRLEDGGNMILSLPR